MCVLTGRIIYSGGPRVARGPLFAHPCTNMLMAAYIASFWKNAVFFVMLYVRPLFGTNQILCLG